MTTILVQGLALLMLIFFGAMALFPLFISDKPATPTTRQHADDRVIHISPVPMIDRIRPVPGRAPLPLGDSAAENETHRREVA